MTNTTLTNDQVADAVTEALDAVASGDDHTPLDHPTVKIALREYAESAAAVDDATALREHRVFIADSVRFGQDISRHGALILKPEPKVKAKPAEKPELLSADDLIEQEARLREIAVAAIRKEGWADDASRLLADDPNGVMARNWAVLQATKTAQGEGIEVYAPEVEKAVRVAAAGMSTGKRIGRTAAELIAEVPDEPAWLIPGVVARKWAVKVAAREKVGKGTLMTYLIGKIERGESSVFGSACEAETTTILTEEPEDSIREKLVDHGVRHALIIEGWELAGMAWPEKVSTVVEIAADRGDALIFCDNISRAAGIEDEAGTELARAIELLVTSAQARGIAVIFDHHHRKGAGPIEDKSRGGTATAGAVDNNIDIERVGGIGSRIRRVTSMGRMKATRWTIDIERTEDDREYVEVDPSVSAGPSTDDAYLAALGSFGDEGATAAQVAEHMGYTDRAVRPHLNDLVGTGRARTEGTRNRASVYVATGKPVAMGDCGGLDF